MEHRTLMKALAGHEAGGFGSAMNRGASDADLRLARGAHDEPAARYKKPAPVRVARDLAALEELSAHWYGLESGAHGPIEQFEWTRACLERLGDLGRLKVFSVWDNGRCRAIAPLVFKTRRWLRLESIGVHELTEPMDLIYADRAALASLCQALAQQRSPINLPRVPASSLVPAEMRRAFQGRALVHVSRSSPYPTMKIDASWRCPESHFNAGRRSDLRRAMRAAEKHGTVTFEVLRPAAGELDGLLNEALEAELNSWKGANGTALLLDPPRLEIYRHYLAALCEKGDLRLAFLRIDGKAVAMQIVAKTNRRLWLLKIGHNEQFSKCSPGTLLMLHLARYAAENELLSIEFLGAVESWTRFWTEDVQECVQVRVYPPSLGTLTSLGYDVWCSLRTRVLRRLRRCHD